MENLSTSSDCPFHWPHPMSAPNAPMSTPDAPMSAPDAPLSCCWNDIKEKRVINVGGVYYPFKTLEDVNRVVEICGHDKSQNSKRARCIPPRIKPAAVRQYGDTPTLQFVNSKDTTVDVIIHYSLFTDSIVCFSLGEVKELFVVNLVVNNCKECYRATRAMSHFVLIVKNKDDIASAVGEYLRMDHILGYYGTYYRYNGKLLHVRWVLNSLHGDIPAEEDMEDLSGMKASFFPSVLDQNQHAQRYSMMEGSLTDMSNTCYTVYDRYMFLRSRNLDSLNHDCAYRGASFIYHLLMDLKKKGEYSYLELEDRIMSIKPLSHDLFKKEISHLASFFELFPNKKWDLWLPTTFADTEAREYRFRQLVDAFKHLLKKNPTVTAERIKGIQHIKKRGRKPNKSTEKASKSRSSRRNRQTIQQEIEVEKQSLNEAMKEIRQSLAECNTEAEQMRMEEDEDTMETGTNTEPLTSVDGVLPTEEGDDQEEAESDEGGIPSELEELLRSFIGEGDKRNEKPRIVDMDKNSFLKRYGRTLLDPMHHIPNFTKKILEYLSGATTKSLRASGMPEVFTLYMKELLYPQEETHDFSFYSPSPLINARAIQRMRALRQKGMLPQWIKDTIVIPSYYMALNDEKCILFSLGFFALIYQDSMTDPFVFCAKMCFDCMGYLYNCTSHLDKAAEVQSILNLFSGLLVSMTPPTFGCVSIMNAQYYWNTLAFYGDMKACDCFQNESSLRLVKGASQPCPNEELSVAKRMQVQEIIEMFMLMNKEAPIVDSFGSNLQEAVIASLSRRLGNMKEAFNNNLSDDMAFWEDNSYGRVTYLDKLRLRVYQYTPKYPNLPVSETYQWWSSVRFRTMALHAADINVALGRQWLIDNSHSLAYTKGFDDLIHVYMVVGYVTSKVYGFDYPLAVCLEISILSGSSFLPTVHYGYVVEDWSGLNSSPLALVSLQRLHFNKVEVIENRTIDPVFLVFTSICIRQTIRMERSPLWERREKEGTIADRIRSKQC